MSTRIPDPQQRGEGAEDSTSAGEITRLLQRWNTSPEAREQLVELVYRHLRRLARGRLRRSGPNATLQVTELVHEAYLRLAGQNRLEWKDRKHFYAIASQAMRRVVLDHCRRYRAGKRIGPAQQISIELLPELAINPHIDVIALDDALDGLARFDDRQARVVELRFFAGLTIRDTAAVLRISPATVKREWQLAQAWLRREMTSRR